MIKKSTLQKKLLLFFSFYSFSLQFAVTIQLINTSSLFNLLGAKGQLLANLWLSGPIIGLIMALIIGELSDVTRSRYGKRKPYIFFFGILLSITLILFPLSQNLMIAAFLLCLLYVGINGCMWPFQAWIADSFSHDQLPIVYAAQAVATGCGGVAAGVAVNGLNHKWQSIEITPFLNVSAMTLSFFLAMAAICLATLTVCCYIKDVETQNKKENDQILKNFRHRLFIFLSTLYKYIIDPPVFLKKIGLAQLFLWYAIYAIWIYLPLALTEHFYGLSDSTEKSIQTALLTKGMELTGICYAILEISATASTLFLPFLLKKMTEGRLLTVFFFLGGSSLIISMCCHTITVLYIAMIGLGTLMGTFLPIPFIALLKQLPKNSRGSGLGVFNITVTIPQIISGLTIGHLHHYLFHKHTDITLLFCGLLIVTGGFCLFYQFFIKPE